MAAPIRIPGPESVGQVGIARDPGGRATAQQFGAGIGEAASGLSETASAIGQHLYDKRKAVEDDVNLQAYELGYNTTAKKAYLNMQGQAGVDPDNFPTHIGETLTAGFDEVNKRLASEGRGRLSSDAQKRLETLRGNILQNYTLAGVTDAHNARVVDLGKTVETNLAQIGTGLAVSGDITAASEQAEQALGSMAQLVDPENLERARQGTNANLGKSVVSYLNTLQDEAVGAPADERQFFVTKGQSLIDQAVSKGWIDPAQGAEAKREWARDYKIRIIKSLEDDPQEIRRLLGDVAPPASGSFVDKVVGAESGGNATAKNPRSSATGAGQFIESTWASFIRERHPDLMAQGADIQKFRNDPGLSREAVQWYADQNAAVLSGAGLPVTDGSLYLAHFAGPAGAKAVLSADPNASAVSVLGSGVVNANPFLRGKTAGDVVAWADKKMGDTTVSMSTHGGPTSEPDPFFADLPADVRMTHILAARADQGRLNDEYVSGVEDYAAYLRNGGPSDGRYSTAELAYQLGPEKGAQVAEGLNRAAEYGEKVNALRMASPAEVTAIQAQEKADLSLPEDFRVNAAEYAGVTKAVQERNTAIAADPAGYVATYDERTKAAYEAMQAAPASLTRVPGGPSIPVSPTVSANNYATAALGAQRKLGVPASMQSILPKTEVAAIAEQFTFQPDGGTNAAEVMQAQEAKWGKHWPQVFAQLARDGNLPGVAMVVGTLNRPGQEQAAKQLAEAANMGEENLKKAIPDEAYKLINDPDDGVEPLMAELRASLAFNGSSGVTTFNSFSASARLLSMYYTYQGDGDNAMTRATNDLINKAYTFPDVNGKTIRVPIEQDEGTIQGGAEAWLRALDGTGLALPEDDFGLDENQTREAYTNSVRANGFWVTSEDESGLTLHDGRGVPVMRTGGTPLTMTWGNLVRSAMVAETAEKAAIVEQGLVPPTVPGGLPTVPGDLPFGLGIE